MNKYETVIGLEVHVELNTKSKMFCACSADYFGKAPNTQTCPVCLGLPGALPFINEEAIKSCIKIGLALNCSVNERSLFERKNYFYPDLAKGYQISQLRWPLNIDGWIDVENDKGEVTKIRINRVHQEEDTGKLTHSGGETLIDYNRCSVPLVEIVTEPDFTESSQIKDYAQKLQRIFRYLGVSNADMEKGDMRLEANISVRKVSSDKSLESSKELPPYRVELKNINSFRYMVAAVEYEIKRQIELYEAGRESELRQETRGWNEVKKETYIQRVKEEANDYRYFPEPDLPEFNSGDLGFKIQDLRDEMPELSMQKLERYMTDLGVSKNNATVLSDDRKMAEYFEGIVQMTAGKVDAQQIANEIVNKKIAAGSKTVEEIIASILEKKAGIIDDEAALEKMATEVISENEASVADYKKGKLNALQALVGGMMKKTRGKADPAKTKKILEKLLGF
jgi:aspartyl-tRNA(Asn)/glutamyl-tRNA(Gln) amidotransferase subunit B